ncbi:MAG: MogA/MoaB family molybdenum cofactor biosynthesis protein [Actinomycetaceae bacterium]|nr:MogA/MoaB family molybdenum cofactor biosynthesis protein [Actinomycetaceae bacterium]
MRVHIVVVSDRCYRGEETDRSGALLKREFEKAGYLTVLDIVPDEQAEIRKILAGSTGNVLLTSGGTGVGPRDVTPEACAALIVKELPGISHLITQKSLEQTPFAAFGRGKAGLTARNQLLVNLPGSTKAASLAAEILLPLLPHFFDQLGGKGAKGKYVEH